MFHFVQCFGVKQFTFKIELFVCKSLFEVRFSIFNFGEEGVQHLELVCYNLTDQLFKGTKAIEKL